MSHKVLMDILCYVQALVQEVVSESGLPPLREDLLHQIYMYADLPSYQAMNKVRCSWAVAQGAGPRA